MARPRKERELPRIQRIELSEKNSKLRWILAGVLLLIGLAFFAIGVNSCVGTQSGWQEVQITANKTNCSADFVLNYCYGQSDLEPTLERRQVVACYSSAVVDGYELFNTDVENSTLGNLTLINSKPNQAVTVEKALYDALAQIVAAKNRHIYLTAVYEEYDRIFRADTEVHAAEFDPAQNEDLLPYIQEAAAFAADPAHIDLVLLGEGKVQLKVSEAYLAFVQDNGIGNLVDLGWMKNAFIADFLASRLASEGHTNGYLASFDGYTRNLDTRGSSYSFNVFDRIDSEIYLPAVLQYNEPMSIVFLRNYPMSARDSGGYYLFSNGRIATAMIDPADGMYKSATDNLVGYSNTASCGQIVLALAPVFVADDMDVQALNALTQQGIYGVWFDGGWLLYNQEDAKIAMQPVEGAAYQAKFSPTE